MSVKELLSIRGGVRPPKLGSSAKATLDDLMKPETFKHTMRSLFDFSAPKSQRSESELAGEAITTKANQIDLAAVPSLKETKYAKLVNAESAYGRTLFGPVPDGYRREFFEHKKNVWIWHDSWLDEVGNSQGITIRYEVRPAGVFKKYVGGNYTRIEGEELDNFRKAARMYLELIKANIYNVQ